MNKSKGNTVITHRVFGLRTVLTLVMFLLTSISLSVVFTAPNYSNVSAQGGLIDRRPVGTSIEGYWTTAPQGYLLEDGTPVSRTTYAALFAILCPEQPAPTCATFGAGDGTTTFNLPDSRGDVTVAKDPSDTDALSDGIVESFNTLGVQGGEKYHTLTLAEMASHDHNLSGQTIAWGASSNPPNPIVYFRQQGGNHNLVYAVGGGAQCGSNNGDCGSTIMYTKQGASGWVDTDNTGGDGAHNNIQPYITLNRAIKY